jgi:hypothetical protein
MEMLMNREASNKSTAVEKAQITALAIGTGLGMSGVTEAAVIYNDSVGFSVFGYGTTDVENLDVNSDGVDDFRFSHYFRPQGSCGYYGYYGYYGGCYIRHFGNSDMTGLGSNGAVVGKMATGAFIGPGQSFSSSQELGDVYYYSDFSPWKGTGILGFVFKIDGENHYGWAELTSGGYYGSVSISKIAYEDVANTKIFAGQLIPIPATAPLLGAALGALGIGAFRRRKREYQAQQEAQQTD